MAREQPVRTVGSVQRAVRTVCVAGCVAATNAPPGAMIVTIAMGPAPAKCRKR